MTSNDKGVSGDYQGDPPKEMEWSIKIIKVSNGFILEKIAGGQKEIGVTEDIDENEQEAGKRMLLAVIDFFGLAGDPFSKNCLAVVMAAGDEYSSEQGEELVPIEGSGLSLVVKSQTA
jgi:hypothetical protein